MTPCASSSPEPPGASGAASCAGLAEAGHDVRGIDLVDAGRTGGPTASSSPTSGPTTRRSPRRSRVPTPSCTWPPIAGETDFATALDRHLGLTHRVLEAASGRRRRAGRVRQQQPRRRLHAASRCWSPSRPAPVRTRSTALGKAAAEALCSLYHDRHGLAVACLRIGSFRERPTTSARSCRRGCPSATRCASSTPACARPISASPSSTASPPTRRAWWDLAPARPLGYRPGRRRRALGGRDRGDAAVGGRRARRPLRRRRLRPHPRVTAVPG